MSELCINRVLSSFWYIPRWINELKTTTMASTEEGALQPVAWHPPLDSKLTIGSSLAPLSSGACQLELWFAPIITNLAILLFSTFVVWGLCKGWIFFFPFCLALVLFLLLVSGFHPFRQRGKNFLTIPNRFYVYVCVCGAGVRTVTGKLHIYPGAN